MEPRSSGLLWRFSLGEVLVAVAIDALLVATILDWVRVLHGADMSLVSRVVMGITYVVFPCILVPFYFATYLARGRRYRAWHGPRNDFMMALDVLVVANAVLLTKVMDSSRIRDFKLIYLFVPIAYTMFLAYTQIVGYLNSDRRVPDPARDEVIGLAGEDRRPAEAEPVTAPTHGPASRAPGSVLAARER